ncbi:hypothetical protein Tco_1239055, partial [Tanacetum coccineum]
TIPYSLFATILDSHVDMKSFMSDVGFSSLHFVFIDSLPSHLARFVVTVFTGSTYEFKLEKDIIRVTPEKVHEILGDICATDIAKKLVLTKRVDFMFKVNFLMLFANVMGTADKMKAIFNLNVLRCIREDTNVDGVDWCGFIHSYLQHSAVPNTTHGFYIGPLTFLTLMYLDSTKFEWFPVISLRPAIKNWTTTAMNLRQDLKIQEEVIGSNSLNVADVHPGRGIFDIPDLRNSKPVNSFILNALWLTTDLNGIKYSISYDIASLPKA